MAFFSNLYLGTLLICIAFPLSISSNEYAISIMELPPSAIGYIFLFLGFLKGENKDRRAMTYSSFALIILSAIQWVSNMNNAISLSSKLLGGICLFGFMYVLRGVVIFAENIDQKIKEETGSDWLRFEWTIIAAASAISFLTSIVANISWFAEGFGQLFIVFSMWFCAISRFGAAIALLTCLRKIEKCIY